MSSHDASFHLSDRRIRFDPGDPGFFQDPYPAYAGLHAAGGIAVWTEEHLVLVASHAGVSGLLRDRRLGRVLPIDEGTGRALRTSPSGDLRHFDALEAHSLLELEPPTHTRLRGLVTRAFVSRAIERLAPRIETVAHELIDAFPKGRVDLVEAFATPLPVAIIAELIGVHAAATPSLLAWSHAMVEMYRPNPDAATRKAADEASRDFGDLLRGTIAERRRTPRGDLVSHLIAAEEDGGRLDEDEMVSTLVLLLNAGHEATVHQIGNGVRAIAEAGLSGAALFASETSSAATVEEMLRFDTPLHLFKRLALEDFEIAPGWRLRRGDGVGLLLGAANRDPAVYDEPGAFRPDRYRSTRAAPAHVAFGGGIHFCLGAPLARLELSLALRVLYERLPQIAIADAPRVRNSWHFRGLERLDVRF
ncbi:hypothetical protein ASG43_13835 [Aureimonas sp. Leaf454]|uniref:cytochrome P450 n=1 Tax=Aureimonas sp. Leaf454 TaxID=1736381 RepID=UPI0007007867|nr:cytochrome P450 [Aureimonas sp. Leaf454]KQT44427.1 hypothetical protein ASG43_13835 [Aureimonas sp. Leaf454]